MTYTAKPTPVVFYNLDAMEEELAAKSAALAARTAEVEALKKENAANDALIAKLMEQLAAQQ